MPEDKLRQGTIGLREVFFQAVSSMAPAASVAFSLILGAKYAGGALCLSVLLALVPCLTVAVSLGQMARHLPTAGAFFTYPARALHPAVGFLANISCMAFFLRERRAELRPWLHLAVPLAGVIGLVPALCMTLGVGASVFSFVTPLTGAAALTGWVIAGWMLFGVAALAVLVWQRPAELARGGAALLGDG